MIRIFRKLRQQLLRKGRFGRYVVYAVGEVVLVVIGILLALQVNNWNEERKSRQSAERSIELLRQEAERIVAYLSRNYAAGLEKARHINAAAEALDRGTLDSLAMDEFRMGVYLTPMFEAATPPRNTYEELKNSGKFNEIGSVDLKRSIAEYYAQLDFFVSQLDYFRIQFENPLAVSAGDFRYVYDGNNGMKIGSKADFARLAANDAFKSAHVKALRDHLVINYLRKNLLELATVMCEQLAAESGRPCTAPAREVGVAGD